ncbi:acyltransferase family protein [Xenorhabdus ehlersii]|uniref:Peptidoglycan/LPS O-acetylase OafA/YrhL n=1 Tax=Xenorhabdus ehlersii TaxID=290111 RepID=A0A2D0IX56_9GAMM|nr:acyltransferase [Xenorhabdus ehlersii]PHM26530.1 hypothetical protein Xehl_00871 [Xenorhabdus ehlersii]RKE91775.1 peptidoglycan/LPS O-acetylase OafA/YrhL [Xenorhabdus ehlersii]
MRRNNCFDVIRLLAALMVLFSHHFALSGMPEPTIANMESLGGISVIVFFSISGYLICMSGMRSEGFSGFMAKRCRRIFPALIPCSIFVFVIIGCIINYGNITEYLSSPIFVNILKTVTLQNVDTSYLASNFIFKPSMMGSLWSLPVEFACYLILGCAISITRSTSVYPLIFAIFLVAALYVLKTGYNDFFFNVPVDMLITRGMCFFLGASLAISVDAWNKKEIKIFTLIILSAYMMTTTPLIDHKIVGYIFFSLLAIFIGVSFEDKVISGKFDYSYGIYIYAFPVQQVSINMMGLGFYGSMILSFIMTIILAALSWHLVESPFLRKKKSDKLNQLKMVMKWKLWAQVIKNYSR